MKKVIYDLVITKVSEVHGEYPGSVDVSFHREGGDLARGERDGEETKRVALSSEVINPDGSRNADRVTQEVCDAVGETETVEID